MLLEREYAVSVVLFVIAVGIAEIEYFGGFAYC